MSLSFSIAFFGLPPFSLFLSLSLSLSFSFLSSFLLVFLFCFLLFACFCLVLSFGLFFAFVSWKEQHQNIQLQSFCSSILSHLCWFPPLLFLSNPHFLIFAFFLDFKFCFLFNISVFSLRNASSKKHNLFKKTRGCNITGFLMNLCFAKCEKLPFLGGHVFFACFGRFFKNTIK